MRGCGSRERGRERECGTVRQNMCAKVKEAGYTTACSIVRVKAISKKRKRKRKLRSGESNPGRPRDRRKY